MKTTLVTIALIAATGIAGATYAQTTPPTAQPGTPTQPTMPTQPGKSMPGTGMPGGTTVPRTGQPTTMPNATGSEAAAKAQLEARGYTGIKKLTRDSAGNWSGKAMKNNLEVAVTLDTRGNVREQ